MGIPLQQQLRDALNQARKGRDRDRTVLLSSTLSEIRNREIELGHEADDDTVREVLARGIKQRRESAEQMRHGKRTDLAEREEAEAVALGAFLPPPLSEEEVRRMVREIRDEGVTQMGPLMGRLVPRIRGRFDGKEANRIVREELAG
ncbi:MAG: GatB/YqeY domain-containing protein [Gemmatimonadota bacterium]